MDPGSESGAESPTLRTRRSPATVPAGLGALSPGQDGDGEVERNPRGMRLRAEYSFGILFIFDSGGFWRLQWY
jgi:hypothetical protein